MPLKLAAGFVLNPIFIVSIRHGQKGFTILMVNLETNCILRFTIFVNKVLAKFCLNKAENFLYI